MKRLNARWQIALGLCGSIAFLGLLARPPEVMLFIFTCFCMALPFHERLADLADRLPGQFYVKLLVSFWVVGSTTEIVAWTNNYLKEASEPALFHPQLVPDLIIGLGFYGGWAVAWWICSRWFSFSIAEAFIITGLQGIFFEQLGAVFLVMLQLVAAAPFQAVLLGLYVFLVHGSIVGLALLPFGRKLNREGGSKHWVRFVCVVVMMVSFAAVGSWLAVGATLQFGGLLPPRSITDHPLW